MLKKDRSKKKIELKFIFSEDKGATYGKICQSKQAIQRIINNSNSSFTKNICMDAKINHRKKREGD